MSTDSPTPGRRTANSAGLFAGTEQEVDTLLIAGVQRRDETALGALYDRWADRAYAVAYHVLGDMGDAEDVVERTFSRVWQDASKYDPARGSVAAWVVVIARSHALSRLQVQRTRVRHDELRGAHAEAEAESTVMAASPLQNLEASEEEQQIHHAVSRLPEEQERVVRMAFFEGLSQTEIASRLGIPLGTVKTRVRLAFAKLRDSLAAMRERNR